MENTLTKRIIPCLDVKEGRVVKGVNFVNLKDAGDPVETAARYNLEGADELIFLDITASYEKRSIMLDVVRKVSEKVFIPFTVGGGIRNTDDIRDILKNGADKISVNTSAVKNPDIITKASLKFGRQCVVVAIDAKKSNDGTYHVFINGGRIDTGLNAADWAIKAEKLGAGEILLTSMDTDGTRKGFDIKLTNSISKIVNIPVIASGGAGKYEDFLDVFSLGGADAALAASLFHYGIMNLGKLKMFLDENNIPVRNLCN